MKTVPYRHPMALFDPLTLTALAEAVASDGPGQHHDALVAVARFAAPFAPGAAAALADPHSPDVVRARALAVIARRVLTEHTEPSTVAA
jgi:hypothetical protein